MQPINPNPNQPNEGVNPSPAGKAGSSASKNTGPDVTQKIADSGISEKIAPPPSPNSNQTKEKDSKNASQDKRAGSASSSPAAQQGKEAAAQPSGGNVAKKTHTWGNLAGNLKNEAAGYLNPEDLAKAQGTAKEFTALDAQNPRWRALATLLHLQVPANESPKNAVLAEGKLIKAINKRFITLLNPLKNDVPEVAALLKQVEVESDIFSKYRIVQEFLMSTPKVAREILHRFAPPNEVTILGVEGLADAKIVPTLIRATPNRLIDWQNLIGLYCPIDSRVAYQIGVLEAYTEGCPELHAGTLLPAQMYAPEAAAEMLIQGLNNRWRPSGGEQYNAVELFVLTGKNQNLVSKFLSYSTPENRKFLLENLQTYNSENTPEIAAIKRGMDLLFDKVFVAAGNGIRNNTVSVEQAFEFFRLTWKLEKVTSVIRTKGISMASHPIADTCFLPGVASSKDLETALIKGGLPQLEVQRILKELETLDVYENSISQRAALARQLVLEAGVNEANKKEGVSKDS